MNIQYSTRNFQHPMKLILKTFSLHFVIGYSVFDIGYSGLKLIAMGCGEGKNLSSKGFPFPAFKVFQTFN
jgi:hypothetical protein